MKYADIGPMKYILQVIDTDLAPDEDMTGMQLLTDEQASRAEAYRADLKMPIWWGNDVTHVMLASDNGASMFMWNEELGDYTNEPIILPGGMSVAEARAVYVSASALFEAMSPGKRAYWEPIRQIVADLVRQGDLASPIAILETMPVVYADAEIDRDAFLALLQ